MTLETRNRFPHPCRQGVTGRFLVPALAALLSSSAAFSAPAASGANDAAAGTEIAFAAESVRATDATFTAPGPGALRIGTGTGHDWPGVAIPAPRGAWDLSRFGEVRLEVRNTGTRPAEVHCRIDNPGADGVRHCVTGRVEVAPGRVGTLRVGLRRTQPGTLGGKLFGMRGYPVERGGDQSVDPAKITQLVVFVAKPETEHSFEIGALRAEGVYVAPTASVTDADPFFPFIDSFGQYRHRDWPGKVRSPEDLRRRREEEARELAAQPGPAEWNRFGGWAAGPQLEATGFFRAAKHEGKWWLVDPEGRLFFSQGIDCVRMTDATPVEERESWFADFPGARPEFAAFLRHAYALKGHYAGRSPRCFSFAAANLNRKYGEDWEGACRDTVHRRLRSWGINTIGNWSDDATRRMRLTPYTDGVGSRGAKQIEGSEGYWGKFPDVFDPSFRDSLRREMERHRGQSAGDPWCLGYFSDNEMSWGDEISLAVAVLKSPPEQAAKREFVAWLRARHGEIAKLNAAWGTAHASWEALLASRATPDKAKARADLEAFSTRIAETYFGTVKESIRETAPRQLYLGCRFAWANPRATAAAAKFCDVVSFNRYERSVAALRIEGADVPLLIGEFHFGALDRGMFHTGLVPVASQEERAAAYGGYVRSALSHPQIVGCHWFQYQDEPTTGRVLDEENYQIGFIDIADTPYPEMTAASRALAAELYRLRRMSPPSPALPASP